MGKSRSELLAESKRKAIAAGAGAAGTVALAATSSTGLAVAMAAGTVYLGYSWWKHRLSNSLKF